MAADEEIDAQSQKLCQRRHNWEIRETELGTEREKSGKNSNTELVLSHKLSFASETTTNDLLLQISAIQGIGEPTPPGGEKELSLVGGWGGGGGRGGGGGGGFKEEPGWLNSLVDDAINEAEDIDVDQMGGPVVKVELLLTWLCGTM